MRKKGVLFICTHNACRSQMAEGLLRALSGGRYESYSAGTEPSGVNPYSIKVMAEIGIDISRHTSKSVKEFQGQDFDYVVTVCGEAEKACPALSGKHEKIHWDLPDPSRAEGAEEEKLALFRRIRDQIKQKIIAVFIGTGA